MTDSTETNTEPEVTLGQLVSPLNWKTAILGYLVMSGALTHILTSEWGSMWSLEHIRVGIVSALILFIGFGVWRGWGFRPKASDENADGGNV